MSSSQKSTDGAKKGASLVRGGLLFAETGCASMGFRSVIKSQGRVVSPVAILNKVTRPKIRIRGERRVEIQPPCGSVEVVSMRSLSL
jgi:hypothetical protein